VNVLSVDYVPYAPENFNTYYYSSYGSYALAIWRDVGATVQYTFYGAIFYDKSRAVIGVDERYRWLFTDGYVTDRTGSFTVPSRSGSNPVIIRARYERNIWVSVSYRPTDTEASPFTPGSISYSPSDANLGSEWWKENVMFTANPNTPNYEFGEWHRDNDYSTVYSTSRTVQPYFPMYLTADFYPIMRVRIVDWENSPLPNNKVKIASVYVAADSQGYAGRYIHPYTAFTVEANSKGWKVFNPYPGVTWNKTTDFLKWVESGSTSLTHDVPPITKPTTYTAQYYAYAYLAYGPCCGTKWYRDITGTYAEEFPRTYITTGTWLSWNSNPVTNVNVKVVIRWKQYGTGIWYEHVWDPLATTSATRVITYVYWAPDGRVYEVTSTYPPASWGAVLGSQWDLSVEYQAYVSLRSLPSGYQTDKTSWESGRDFAIFRILSYSGF